MARQVSINNVVLELEKTPDGMALNTNIESHLPPDEGKPHEALELLMLDLVTQHGVALDTLARAAASTAETLHKKAEATEHAARKAFEIAYAGDDHSSSQEPPKDTQKADPERAQQLRDDIHQLGFDSLVYFSGDRAHECWRHASGACAVIDVQALRIIKFTTTNGLIETTTGELGWPNRNLAVFANQVISMARMAFNGETL